MLSILEYTVVFSVLFWNPMQKVNNVKIYNTINPEYPFTYKVFVSSKYTLMLFLPYRLSGICKATLRNEFKTWTDDKETQTYTQTLLPRTLSSPLLSLPFWESSAFDIKDFFCRYVYVWTLGFVYYVNLQWIEHRRIHEWLLSFQPSPLIFDN